MDLVVKKYSVGNHGQQMDNSWINIRFGVRHLQIGPDRFSFGVNPYHVQNKPEKMV
jgi:hypothetical protein